MAAWTDEEVEIRVGQLLRWGVIIAAAVTSAGACVFLMHGGATSSAYRTFPGQPGLLHFQWADGTAVIWIGLALIVATPVARVLFAIYSFFRERDWRYVGVSLVVLALLCFALFHGA